MEQLAKAANSAVRNCFWGDDNSESDVEDDDIDDDETEEREDEAMMDVDDDVCNDEDKEEAAVCRLVARISGWCRANSPQD